MNQEILDRNLLALIQGSPDTAHKLTKADISKSITFKPSKNGQVLPFYQRSDTGHKSVHSTFDPIKEANRLFSQYNPEGMFLILGLGGGYHIRPFLKENNISSIIIIENNLEEVKSILQTIDMTDIFLDKRVSLWISEKSVEFSDYLLGKYIPVLSGNMQTVSLRARVLMDEPFYSELTENIKTTIGQIKDDYTVQTHFGKRWFINTLYNLNKSETTTQTLNPIKNAYITAAGPSLEKHLDFLRNLKSKGTIIATDTSLPVLLSGGIKPDLVISIDCQHISYNHFMKGYPEDVPLILDLASPSFLTRIAKKIFFFTSDHPFSNYVSQEFRQFPRIDTSGGNVTHAALSLADTLGARNIYLIGADFSYPSGKPYARNSYIYPYFFYRSNRYGNIENQIYSFIFHNKSIHKEKTEKGFRYISKPMIHYKASIERKAAQCEGDVSIIPGDGVSLNLSGKKSISPRGMKSFVSAGIPSKSYKDFLLSYKQQVNNLPELKGPVSEYMDSLSFDQKKTWITLLPIAAQFRKNSETGQEAITQARSWCLDSIERVLSLENHTPIINKI